MRALARLRRFLHDWKGPSRPSLPAGLASGVHLSAKRRRRLAKLEKTLDYQFRDISLLERALVHRSYSHQAKEAGRPSQDYEALEFFGDTVLDLVISEVLLLSQPRLREGQLSKQKAHLVSTQRLADLSRQIGLGKFLKLSPGEEKTGGRGKKAILADIFESVTAALYLDGGLEPARRFVLSGFQPLLAEVTKRRIEVQDFKSALQEHLHSLGQSEPRYQVVSESGPDHRKEFRVEVVAQGKTLARGRGFSKKEAEQMAAERAMEEVLP